MMRNRETMKTLALVAFLAGGLLLVWAGALPIWAWNVLVLLTIGARVITGLDRYSEELSITDHGITRKYGSRFRRQVTESVSWEELSRVEAIAHEAGARKDETLFLLYGSEVNGVAVPASVAQKHGLVDQLRQRLAGFRDDEMARALAASSRETFVLWEKAAA
jgi:hypothetical protein